MSGLSDDDKARIRREEAARIKALEEERYRAEVRAELEAELAGREGGDKPVVVKGSRRVLEGEAFVWTEPPPEARAEVGRRAPKVAPWWALAALLLAGGGALLVFALLEGGGAGEGPRARDRVELSLQAAGAFAEVARPPWEPGQLATDEYRVDEAGRVTSVPGRGLERFEDWRAAYETPPPVMRELFPERPTLPELEGRSGGRPFDASTPRLRLREDAGPGGGAGGDPGAAAAFEDLLMVVPPQAWMVIGVAQGGVARSPALTRARLELARQLGAMSPLSVVGGESLLLGADRIAYAAVLDDVDGEEEFLVSAATPEAGRVRDAALAAGATVNAGVFEWLALPSGEGLIVEPGRLSAARPRTTPSMIAARAGDSVGWAGALSPMLRRVRGASAIFAVVHLRNADPADLERTVPGLGRAKVFGASVDVGEAITARLHIQLGDITEATRLLAELERLRGAAAGSPQAALLSRISPTIDGAVLTLTLILSEHELAALGREVGLQP